MTASLSFQRETLDEQESILLWQDDPDVPYCYLRELKSNAHQLYQQQIADTQWLTVREDGKLLGMIEANLADWDSEMTGIEMGRLARFHISAQAREYHLLPLVQMAMAELHHAGCRYIFVRTDGRGMKGRVLQQLGFIVFDGVISFGLPVGYCDEILLKNSGLSAHKLQTGNPLFEISNELSISQALPQEANEIANLAADTLTQGRFYSDPVIPRDRAEHLHREWVRNSLSGKIAETVLVLRQAKQILGFVTIKLDRKTAGILLDPGIASIDLIAVSQDAQGQGFGQYLTYAAALWCVQKNIPYLQVATQLWNHAAIRCYTRVGFEYIATALSLRHLKNPYTM